MSGSQYVFLKYCTFFCSNPSTWFYSLSQDSVLFISELLGSTTWYSPILSLAAPLPVLFYPSAFKHAMISPIFKKTKTNKKTVLIPYCPPSTAPFFNSPFLQKSCISNSSHPNCPWSKSNQVSICIWRYLHGVNLAGSPEPTFNLTTEQLLTLDLSLLHEALSTPRFQDIFA